MIELIVNNNIIEHCNKQIEVFNFGKRGVADGTKEQQLTGIIGQSVLMELFDAGLIDGSKGFDGGKDILYNGIKIDVKTMGRTTDMRSYYVHNFIGLQKDYDTDIYIFCSYNKTSNKLTICGWISKDDLIKKATLYPKGTIRTRSNGTTFEIFTDLYELANTTLNNVDTIEELKQQITNGNK